MDLNATTMLGQGKNIVQAEIDAACELVDFLRFNSYFALGIEKYKPIDTSAATNSMIYRALEGFVAAVAPFNFTAIGGNLSSAPALMGNTVLWKPSDTAVLSNYIIYKILEEAGKNEINKIQINSNYRRSTRRNFVSAKRRSNFW